MGVTFQSFRPPTAKPRWVRSRVPGGRNVSEIRNLLDTTDLHTVCESAKCPNLGECWAARTATFMILGDICSRSCGFCSVRKGRPDPLDNGEPNRVAEAAARLGLRHVVLTSVNRDELPDGGASAFAATVSAIRQSLPDASIEALIPDFGGDAAALGLVFDARPDILAHNVETVPRLYRTVRPQAKYPRSIEALRRIHEAGIVSKTGVMVGLGERDEELEAVMRDAAGVGCDILTIGQYLQPTPTRLPVTRYYSPEEFVALRETALRVGLRVVESGVFARSSYRADALAGEAFRRAASEPQH